MKFYPSVLTDSIEEFQRQVDLVKPFSEIEVVQADIIDGFFVDNITVSPMDLVDIDFGNLNVDLHLMVEEPMDYFLEASSLGEHIPIRAVIGQIERMSHQEDFLLDIKKHGWKAGLSLDLHTPVEEIEDVAWELLDVVQLMGIEAGFQGQKFDSRALDKIKKIVSLSKKHQAMVEILVDGGVKLENLEKISKAGATSIIVGSALWKANDTQKSIQQFTSAASLG